jgi:hypothetical protein
MFGVISELRCRAIFGPTQFVLHLYDLSSPTWRLEPWEANNDGLLGDGGNYTTKSKPSSHVLGSKQAALVVLFLLLLK